jgi:single-stranded-DNA-specific exonuclease
MQAFFQATGRNLNTLYDKLDIVAVSIASDIVPITGENRILEYYGLQKINKSPSMGISAIKEVAGMSEREMKVSDVVFKIGPRINAAGRLESGMTAVDLLITEDRKFAERMSVKINNLNNDRKDLDANITESALEMIMADEFLSKSNSTVIYNENWHKGVIGIVASRVIESFYRPTIILTRSNGLATGSARSVEGFDLYRAIDACSHLLENYGGHMHAAGLSLKIEKVEPFRQRFEEVVSQQITPEQKIPVVEIDSLIQPEAITKKFYTILKQFQPFGPQNMTPVFCAQKLTDNGTAKLVGSDGSHMKLDVASIDNPSHMIPAIAFSMTEQYEAIKEGCLFDMCFTIDENVFRGMKSLQLMVKDIKICVD